MVRSPLITGRAPDPSTPTWPLPFIASNETSASLNSSASPLSASLPEIAKGPKPDPCAGNPASSHPDNLRSDGTFKSIVPLVDAAEAVPLNEKSIIDDDADIATGVPAAVRKSLVLPASILTLSATDLYSTEPLTLSGASKLGNDTVMLILSIVVRWPLRASR